MQRRDPTNTTAAGRLARAYVLLATASAAWAGCPAPCPGFDECRGKSDLPGPLLGVRGVADQEVYNFSQRKDFPASFQWGVGTAAYQIEGAFREGGRGASIWDTFTGANTVGMPGSVCHSAPCPVNAGMVVKGATGNVANAHYYKWRKDVATMAGLGVRSYRFSISWPRIVPTGIVADGINREGLDFYHHLVDALLEEGIEPVVSIYHWDLPQGLLDANYDEIIPACDDFYKQGWFECSWDEEGRPIPSGLESSISQHYLDYVDVILHEFAGKVSSFYTFNEPWTFTYLGSSYGHAPGVAPYINQTVWPYVAAHNVILSHLKAVMRFKELQAGELAGKLASAKIGIVLNADWVEPAQVHGKDISAAVRSLESQLGWFADPIWGRLDGTHDYPESMKRLLGHFLPAFSGIEKELLKAHRPDMFGINHYATTYGRACQPVESPDGRSCKYDCSCTVTPSKPDCAAQQGVPDLVSTDDVMSSATVATGSGRLPQGQSAWLHPASWGFRKLLAYITTRYMTPAIYVTENGISLHADAASDAQYDTGRLMYLFSYLSAMHSAIEDGADVRGYFAWSLMDNFEWSMGYSERFGLLFNEFQFCSAPMHPSQGTPTCDPDAPSSDSPIYNPLTGKVTRGATCGASCLFAGVPDPSLARNQTRHTKNSLSWLTEVWSGNAIVDPSVYLLSTSGPQCWGEGVYEAPGYHTLCSTARRRGRERFRRQSPADTSR